MVLGFSKKKRKVAPDLPPPPAPPQKVGIPGDFEPIKPKGPIREVPEVSVKQATLEAPSLPEVPKPPLPEPPKSLPSIEKPEPKMISGPLPAKKVELRKIYDKTIQEQAPERKEVIRHIPTKPIFVSTQDYKKIMIDSNMIKARLLEADEFINRLNTIEKEEEILFEKWRLRLEDVEKKLGYVDSIIAKSK